jgi:organic radical activating enzyme
MSDFYCPNIHNNLRIEGSNVIGLRLLPCCVYRTDNVYSTLEQYNTSPEIVNLKNATEWPKECNICKHDEVLGQRSLRQDAIATWEHLDNVKRVEIFPSNVCNLKCMMCVEQTSTALAQERHAIGDASEEYLKEFNIVDQALDIVSEIDNVSIMSLIGGEFFLTKRNIECLDFAIKHDLELRVFTNATVILNQHIEKLKQIKKLELQISLEGFEDSYHFMRYPGKWDVFSNNVNTLIKELPVAKINFNIVAQVTNLLHIIPTLDWTNRQKKPTKITNLSYPGYLTWDILKPQEQDAAVGAVHEQLNNNYVLTQQQRQHMLDLCDIIKQSQYNFQLRNKFIEHFTKTMLHRKITAERVQQHLGVLGSITRI